MNKLLMTSSAIGLMIWQKIDSVVTRCAELITHFLRFEELAENSPIWRRIFAIGSFIWRLGFGQLWRFLTSGILRLFRTNERIPAPHNPARRRLLAGGFAAATAIAMLGIPVPAWAATTYFVNGSTGNNASSGADWSNAKQTVAGAIAVPVVAGDIIIADKTGTFTANAAITWTPPGGGLAIISATNNGGTSYTPATGAVEAVGAANSLFTIAAANGSGMYCYGMTVNGGTNASTSCSISIMTTASAAAYGWFQSCTFDIKATTSSLTNNIGSTNSTSTRGLNINFQDCTFARAGSSTGSVFTLGTATINMFNPTISAAGANKPATLMLVSTLGDKPNVTIEGDISGFNFSSTNYVNVANFTKGTILIKNSKISGTPGLTTGTWPGGESALILRNTDSGDTINVFKYVNTYGTLDQNTSVTLDSGSGGAQFNGSSISWKIVTTSSATQFNPFISPPIETWSTSTSAQTAAIEFVRDNATSLTDQDIWASLESAASASFPNYTYQTDRNSQPITGSASNQPSSSVTWNGTGGFSNENKQKLNNAFTAAEVGLIQSRVYVGKASETLYVNPRITGVT